MSLEEKVQGIAIEQEIKSSFLDYSMSVIVSRALPDVRDGLKPVHRRILYAMYELKNFHNRPYVKSARVVGQVIGKYHPHGDTSVYDALVRMAQEFSLRYMLVDGQGNFGSVDGDSAAAMRYTEARMQQVSEYLLRDLELDTVDFVPNYDGKDQEPSVLPVRVPQLLANGATGIAVGMATNIPPHNLGEIASGLKALITNPDIDVMGLMDHIKGPDFPTAAEIHGVSGIREAYATGRGMVLMRAKAFIEDVPKSGGRERIVVTELPYQVNKARLLGKIADLVRAKRIEGISDVRDESNRAGIRMVIELKKGEASGAILNQLFKLTALQSSFGVNMVVLVAGQPRLLNLKEVLQEFYKHRREVVLRRTAHLLRKAEERAHVLEGLKIAIENMDAVIALIRDAESPARAQEQLQSGYEMTQIQAKAVLEMKLSRLTGLERDKIVAEYKEVIATIEDLRDILQKKERVTEIVLEELGEVEEKFGDARRTEIFAEDADEITLESLVADEEVTVTITHGGYVKRTASSEISAQRRGGKGRSGMMMKDGDFIHDVFTTTNHRSLLCFSDRGQVYQLRVFQLPEEGLRRRGKHFANLLPNLESGERIVSVLPVSDFSDECFVYSVTSKGMLKKTKASAYVNLRANGIIGLKLSEGDSLVRCLLGRDDLDVLIATSSGKCIRFNGSTVRAVGRNSQGVMGVRVASDDRVVGLEMIAADGPETIFSVCENGYGKRSAQSEYRTQSRGGKGIYTVKVTEKTGPVVGICQVREGDDMILVSSIGKMTRISIDDVSILGRVTQGVRLMNVAEDEKVIGFTPVPQDEAAKKSDC